MNTEHDRDASRPFDPTPLPRHVAIIMDGNGRWAQARGKSRSAGHEAGAVSVRKTVEACGDWGIEYLTLYAFSSENWERPAAEVAALMGLLKRYLEKETKTLRKHNVRFNAIGDLARLPADLQEAVGRARDDLSVCTGPVLTLALSYGSRDEIMRAVRRLARDVADGEIAPETLTETDLASRLDTYNLPDPDLLIRTAGEQRLSNYLLWQASYAELHFTDVCWPEFRREQLAAAIRDYQRRKRKFGKTEEQVAAATEDR